MESIVINNKRVTLYKIGVKNSNSSLDYSVYKRYSEFVELSNKLSDYAHLLPRLPLKRFLSSNTDPQFVLHRAKQLDLYLQATFILINAGILKKEHVTLVKNFLCHGWKSTLSLSAEAPDPSPILTPTSKYDLVDSLFANSTEKCLVDQDDMCIAESTFFSPTNAYKSNETPLCSGFSSSLHSQADSGSKFSEGCSSITDSQQTDVDKLQNSAVNQESMRHSPVEEKASDVPRIMSPLKESPNNESFVSPTPFDKTSVLPTSVNNLKVETFISNSSTFVKGDNNISSSSENSISANAEGLRQTSPVSFLSPLSSPKGFASLIPSDQNSLMKVDQERKVNGGLLRIKSLGGGFMRKKKSNWRTSLWEMTGVGNSTALSPESDQKHSSPSDMANYDWTSFGEDWKTNGASPNLNMNKNSNIRVLPPNLKTLAVADTKKNFNWFTNTSLEDTSQYDSSPSSDFEKLSLHSDDEKDQSEQDPVKKKIQDEKNMLYSNPIICTAKKTDSISSPTSVMRAWLSNVPLFNKKSENSDDIPRSPSKSRFFSKKKDSPSSPLRSLINKRFDSANDIKDKQDSNMLTENSHAKTKQTETVPSVVSLSDFYLLKLIGKGNFGKVLLAQHKATQSVYAIKVISKSSVKKKKQNQDFSSNAATNSNPHDQEHIMAERNVLIRSINHPFLIGLRWSFQTANRLYFVTDYINGGELFFHLQREGRFNEGRARFYAAEMVSALAYLHVQADVVYRDLKPENILLDSEGHINGLAKENFHQRSRGRTSTFCGTPEYLAPEVIKKEPYGFPVDWWCLGAVLFEMLVGLPPFYSKNTNEMYEKILHDKLKFPPHISLRARSIISGLLHRSAHFRLGSGPNHTSSPHSLKLHPFFEGMDWNKLERREITPPYIPEVKHNYDLRNIDPTFVNEPIPNSVMMDNLLHKNADKGINSKIRKPEEREWNSKTQWKVEVSATTFENEQFQGFTFIPEADGGFLNNAIEDDFYR